MALSLYRDCIERSSARNSRPRLSSDTLHLHAGWTVLRDDMNEGGVRLHHTHNWVRAIKKLYCGATGGGGSGKRLG